MKSIERKFRNIAEQNPYWSSYTCFALAVSGSNFSELTVSRWFSRLVEKDDYARKDKRAILAHLRYLTKPLEDDKKSGVLRPRRGDNSQIIHYYQV